LGVETKEDAKFPGFNFGKVYFICQFVVAETDEFRAPFDQFCKTPVHFSEYLAKCDPTATSLTQEELNAIFEEIIKPGVVNENRHDHQNENHENENHQNENHENDKDQANDSDTEVSFIDLTSDTEPQEPQEPPETPETREAGTPTNSNKDVEVDDSLPPTMWSDDESESEQPQPQPQPQSQAKPRQRRLQQTRNKKTKSAKKDVQKGKKRHNRKHSRERSERSEEQELKKQKQLVQSLEQKLDECENVIREQNQVYEAYKTAQDAYRNEMDNVIESKANEVDAALGELIALRSDMRTLEQKARNVALWNQGLQDEIKRLKADLAEQRGIVAEQSATLEASSAQRNQAFYDLKQLDAQRREQESQIQSLTAELEIARKENARLHQALDDTTDRFAASVLKQAQENRVMQSVQRRAQIARQRQRKRQTGHQAPQRHI
jgi:hypothetical protein